LSFSFKQFTIHQDRCAMKVCTDACLFGAWVAAWLEEHKADPQSILDIGTGTGLLSLMLAQKTSALIAAVEINEEAAGQAKENFEVSPWGQRLSVVHANAAAMDDRKQYDCIISNPPFFESDLRSPDQNKNAAKHDSTITFESLLKIISTHLLPGGTAALLIPFHRLADLEKVAAMNNLFILEHMLVRQTPRHQPFRAMLIIGAVKKEISFKEMIIHDAGRNYTPDFIGLLGDYYLRLTTD
jgi:tRNA1Val (adenine37-N6)-methyltransferase